MKINYKNKLVLFIDVLGFSNLVNNSSDVKLEDYFKYINSEFKEHMKTRKFDYFVISDSLVVSANKTEYNLGELLFIIGKIQYQLLLKGILTRGALSSGNLYINKSKNIIVGPGLINAYQLENLAKYPRVIIDRKIIKDFYSGTNDFLESAQSNKFLELFGQDNRVKFDYQNQDGFPYVNFLQMTSRYDQTFKSKNFKRIIALFEKHYFDNHHFEKYDWLLKNFIEELKIAITHYQCHPEILAGEKKILKIKDLLYKLESL